MEITDYCIYKEYSLRSALVQLESLRNVSLTLFVVDDDNKMMGTLTDGDIRRALIRGANLEDHVSSVMNRDYSCICLDHVNVGEIESCKDKGIKLLPCLNSRDEIVEILDFKRRFSMLPIDAVLMAGGKGERLRPLTERVPKPLLPVGGKAIIDYNVERLISYGINHISVTTNYLHEQVEEHFNDTIDGVQVKCVCEPKYLGTIGSVKFVDTFCNDTVLVMNSDLFTNIDYKDFYLHFIENGADMSVAAVPYSISIPYGIFELDGRDIHGVREKPTYNYYANAGIYLIKKSLLDLIPNDTFYNATDFMEMLIREKMKVVRFPITGYWIDIGKPEDYKRAQELVKHL